MEISKSKFPLLLVLMFISVNLFAQNALVTDTSKINSLTWLFSSTDAVVRVQASEALVKIGKAALPSLCRALQDTSGQVRIAAAITMCRMGNISAPAIDCLIAGLNDSERVVRLQCAFALRNIKNENAKITEALKTAVRDKDNLVRKTALKSMKIVNPEFFTTAPDINKIIFVADSLIPLLRAEYKVPGVSLVLIRNNKVVHTANFGVSDVRTNNLVDNETMFEACSMSKPLFSYIALKLAESGKLDLDKPVFEYYDEPAFMQQPERKKITARMLLSHKSGLPNWRPGDEVNEGLLPVLFEPGMKFWYSGEGMFLLQKVVEKITGEPLEVYAEKSLFLPLGMKHSSFIFKDEFDSHIASGHNEDGTFRTKTSYRRANAGYSLYCSAEDYAVFLLEILKKDRSSYHSLSQKWLDEMLKRQSLANIREPIERPGRATSFEVNWGLGWGINSTLGNDIFYHSGSNSSGFTCYSQFSMAEGSGIVVMTNSYNGDMLWKKLIAEIGDL